MIELFSEFHSAVKFLSRNGVAIEETFEYVGCRPTRSQVRCLVPPQINHPGNSIVEPARGGHRTTCLLRTYLVL
jgi:hypothetical protein